ncbi:unnamed protein product [Rotaria sordida]|uniref:Lipocalin/cytosolic fatty-acid binding domain-containing protein n=1 Tax=Rotaria sordida TaxID=392033 RepID=A0A819SWA2_9BILA|nr:unnamed protein product [Rotaria sordida]
MSSQVTNVVGTWKIVDYSQHPECFGCQIEIKHEKEDENMYRLRACVINDLNCTLQHNSTTNQWQMCSFRTTEMGGSPEDMKKEDVISNLMRDIQKMEVQGEQQLIIQTNNGEQARLDRLQ